MDRFLILEAVAAESDELRRQPSQLDGVPELTNTPESRLVMLEEYKGQSSSVVSITRSRKSSTEINLADQETNSPSSPSGENELTQNCESNSYSEGAGNNDIADQSSYFSSESDHTEAWHDDHSSHKRRISFSVVSLELFKFSRQYEQLKHEMNSTEKTFEAALTCETSRKTLEFCKKFQYEKERLEELVEKMLLNCDIEGFREQRVKDSGNDGIVLGGCSKGTVDSQKCQCSGILTLREDNKESTDRVALASQEEPVQTENNLSDCSQEDHLEKDKVVISIVSQKEVCVQTENNNPQVGSSQDAARLARDLEYLQQKHQQITREYDELQGKIFEVESELCSVEIERDLKNETARYLEEQVVSVSSGLSMRENELVSLRKRYKFLNEALQSSEELRERLESETSRMSVVIKELEERLEKDPQVASDIFNKDPTDSEGVHFDFTKDVERLEEEISEVNAALEKEKVQRNGVEEMLDNVEKERELLLTELDELKNAYQVQRVELEEYKEKRHNASKKELQEKESRQQDQQQASEENNEELQENIVQLSRRILFLEDVNKKLEGEIYQQLEVMEKMETENTASRQELESISSEVKKVKLETVEELVAGYHALKSENEARDEKMRQFESVDNRDVKAAAVIELDPELCRSTSRVKDCCCKLYSVPRSEYVKLKFQLRSMSDEMRLLKEVTVPEAMENLSVAAKTMAVERTSLKNETNVVNKWLNSMKESVGVVMEKDEVISKRFDSVLLETQLHDARINLIELQHEIEMIKKDKELLLSQNGDQEKALNVLKQRIVEDQIRYENTLKELKEKFERLKKELKDEKMNHIKEKAKVVALEERNVEVDLEFENVKRKLECLERGKKTVEEELKKIKLDVLKFFGGEPLESVYESWSDTRKKCSEYVKVIENNKNIIFKCQRDLDALTNVNTALRKEVNEAKVEKEKKSQKWSGDVSPGAEQIQTLMQPLETGKKNEHELLGKKKQDESEEQMNIVRNELEKVRLLLSEKECEYETSKVIIQELEDTCQVYENEFEKMTNTNDKNDVASTAYRSCFSSDLTMNEATLFAESVVPQDENESTADNVRELQEMVQESLATKLRVLQRHFGELAEALCACRELNVSLQQRLHSVEMKHLENEAKNIHRRMDEEFEKVLKEVSERERSMEEMLCKPCPECNSDWGAVVQSANCEHLKDTLLHCKEVITRLRTDNETCEEKLVEAHEIINEHEQKIAMIDYCIREKNIMGTDNDVEDIRDMKGHSCPDESRGYVEMETESEDHHESVILEDENTSLDYSADQVTDGTTCFSRGVEASSRNLKEELDCVTAKYINIRAAFEGCQRRLKFLESGTRVDVMNDEAIVMATDADAVVQRRRLETRSVGDAELSKVAERRICSNLTKNTEKQIPRNEPVSIPGNGRNPSQTHSWTQTVQNLDNYRQSSLSLLSEISVNFSETSDDAGVGTEQDHIVIELTLRETEMDVLESQRNFEEMDEGKLESDYLRLRNKIQQLESIVLSSTNEVQRVKVCSFEEMLNFESDLKNMKDGNALLTTKLGGLEHENGELRYRVEELEAKLLACDQETQRIQIHSFTEKQVFDNTITNLQDTNHTIAKRIEELEEEKRNLDIKIEEVEARVLGCYNETQRVKVCSFNERQTFCDIVKTLQNTLSIRENDVDEHKNKNGHAVFKMRGLKDQVSVCNEEIQRIKVCSFNERKNLENNIKNLQDVKTRWVAEDRKKQKDDLETKMKEHEAKISTRDEEIERIKVCSFSEIENLEDTVKNLKDTIVTTEKQVEETTKEKAQMESKVKVLEDRILSRDEEIKRIKVCAFSEQEKLKDTIKTAEAMKTARFAELKKVKDDLETRMKEHEAKILSCGGEIKRIKVCAFNEKKTLEGTINNLQNEIATTAAERVADREREKADIELRLKGLEDKVMSCNEEKQRLKVCSFNERETVEEIIKKLRHDTDKNLLHKNQEKGSILLMKMQEVQQSEEKLKIAEEKLITMRREVKTSQETLENIHLENISLKQSLTGHEVNVLSLKTNMDKLESEKKNVEDVVENMKEETRENNVEKRRLQEAFEGAREECDVLREKIRSCEKETSALRINVANLENEKRNLESSIKKSNEKLLINDTEKSNLRENIEKHRGETEVWEENLRKRKEEETVLRKKLEELENEKENLKILITEMDEKRQKEIKNLRETIEMCNEESRVWKQKVHFHEEEVIILRKKLEQVENENEDLKRLMTEMDEQKQKEIKNLGEVNEKCNNEIDSWKMKLRGCQDDVIILRTNVEELENEKWRNEEKEKEKQFLEANIESSRKTVIVLNAEIEEVSVKKVGLEKQLRDLNLTVEKEKLSWREKKENYQQDISNLREIMDELMQSKLTLLEEISQLSDQKKEGQKVKNNEMTHLRKLYNERQNEHEIIKQEKSKLEFQVSSLKITLDTLQSAYEQSQDDNKQNEKRLQELRGQAIKNHDKQKLVNENGRLKSQVNALENKLSRNSETENKELLFSLKGTESRLTVLEKEKETYKNENVVLMERLKQLELSNEENSHSTSSSTQVNNLRKKLKEFRSKLGEEKKQREVCEFEIKNLKEKVERLTKKEKEVAEKLDANRTKFLEMKTERDALRLDLEGMNKKRKREVEGYTSTIESLVNEVKSFKEKEMNKEDGKQLKKTLAIVNEQNKLLEMKLAANAERSTKENQDSQNSLKLLQERYDSEQKRSKNMETKNQSDILELKKSLSAIERECEKKAKELDKLKDNLSMINNEKERIEKLLNEKASEGKKWKKEAFDAKAEISFLRGALNILEREGVTKKAPGTNDLATSA